MMSDVFLAYIVIKQFSRHNLKWKTNYCENVVRLILH